jgi:hypothetical protein
VSWATIRAAAKRVVHDTFAREALYTGPEVGDLALPARIRLHTQFLRFGDLDREGYAQVIDDVNQVMIDVGEVVPKKNGRIDFEGIRIYRITEVVKETGEQFWMCRVQPE